MAVFALALGVALASPAAAEIIVVATPRTAILQRAPVPDVQLAAMRGGVALPNGLIVAIGIDIQTRIDGVLVLHTIYGSDGPNAGVRVFTDGVDAPRTAPATATVETPASIGLPTLTVSRAPGGPTVQPGIATPATTVNLVNGDPATWLTSAGQMAVPVVENGPAVTAQPGLISLRNDGDGAIVTLDAPMVRVQQLIGQTTGAVIVNTGNNRAIDTISSVNVDLQGLSPALMSAIFAVQRIAVEAATR